MEFNKITIRQEDDRTEGSEVFQEILLGIKCLADGTFAISRNRTRQVDRTQGGFATVKNLIKYGSVE